MMSDKADNSDEMSSLIFSEKIKQKKKQKKQQQKNNKQKNRSKYCFLQLWLALNK